AAIRAIARDPSIVLPLAVLLLLALVVGAVNSARWGDPFTFVDFRYYYWGLRHSNFLDILRDYGEINLGRAWIGALYYGTGNPYLFKECRHSPDSCTTGLPQWKRRPSHHF